MVFVFSSQRILKPLDINSQDKSVNRDTVVLRSSRTGSGGGLDMFGGRPAGPKTVVFCFITAGGHHSQLRQLSDVPFTCSRENWYGEKDTSLSSVPVNCSPVQSEVSQCADTPVNQYSSFTGKTGVSWCLQGQQVERLQSTIKVPKRRSTNSVTHFCLRVIRKCASLCSRSALSASRQALNVQMMVQLWWETKEMVSIWGVSKEHFVFLS